MGGLSSDGPSCVFVHMQQFVRSNSPKHLNDERCWLALPRLPTFLRQKEARIQD
jgi:hypothetical protein